MTNPFAVLPPIVRKYAYLVAFLVGAGFTAYQAAEGNVAEAIGLGLGTLIPLLASSNTPVTLTGVPKE